MFSRIHWEEMKSARFFFAIFAGVLATAADSNWPQFRGPAASGVGSGSPPTEWNVESGKNILWSVEIPGLGHSSPVIWGDRIYLTSAVADSGDAKLKTGLYGDIMSVPDEGVQKFVVYCIDRKTGKIVWQQVASSGVPKIKRHPIVSFGSEGLYAYDLKGKLEWKKDLGVLDSGFYMVPGAQWGFASSPIIHDSVVLVQADVQKDSFLAAFDVATGKELWRTPRKDVPTFGSPAVVPYTGAGGGKLQVVVNGWKEIAGYDFKTGKQLWTLKGGGDIPVPTPVFSDGVVVITNAHGSDRPIFAIKTDAEGNITGSKTAFAWTIDRAGNYMETPLLDKGIGYFCFDNGILTTYQMATGEKLYQQRLGGTTGFTSSPVASHDRLYITNEDGHTFVLAKGTEYKVVGENDLGEQVMSTAAISGDVLYMRGRTHLFAIGSK
jgi:outer membrane protein assembly factor BamB